MSVLAAALAEKMRREDTESRLRGAIKNRFEVIPHRRWEATSSAERVPCMDVYRACAEAVAQYALTVEFCRRVKKICVGLGAVPIHPFNRHAFAFMRIRVQPGDKAALAAETKRWYAKAQAEGFEDIERGGELRRESRSLARNAKESGDHVAAAIKMAHFDKAKDLYWKLARDLQIMELYAMQGKTVREIAAELEMGRSTVQDRLRALRERMGGQPGPDEDNDDGADSRRRDRDGPGGDR